MGSRLVIVAADRNYLVGLVGLLETMRMFEGDRPSYDVLLWYKTKLGEKRPGSDSAPDPGPDVFKLQEELSDEEIIARLTAAYPFMTTRAVPSIPSEFYAKHVFYVKAWLVNKTVSEALADGYLYLDVDCLVNDDTERIWKLIESGFFLLSVDPCLRRLERHLKVWQEALGEKIYPRGYGCAGVFGFPSKFSTVIPRWVEVTALMIDLLTDADYKELAYGATDQDALNAVTAAESFPELGSRMIPPRDIFDFQRNFYDSDEAKTVALPDPLRVELHDRQGRRITRPAILHAFDKWWKHGCRTPAKSLGVSALQASPVFDMFRISP
jgi:hypothetical protein